MTLTAQQSRRLKRAYAEFGEALRDLGLLEEEPKAPPDPQWLRETAKQWSLLSTLATEYGSDVSSEEWSRLGRAHGYDPRGLGGFFVGSKPLMATQGARRVLTEHGQRFVDRWRADFEPRPKDTA